MERIVSLLAVPVRRAPWAVVAVIVAITAVLGVFAAQITQADGQEGFAPDNAQLQAAETIGERFGGGGASEVVQIVIAAEDGRAIGLDGLQAVAAVGEAIESSDVARYLADQPGQPPIASYLDPVLLAAGQGAAPPQSDEQVQQAYVAALAQLPAEQAGIVEGLLPADADAAAAEADSGLMLVFLDAEAITDGDPENFQALLEVDQELERTVRDVDLPDGITAEPFVFTLLFDDSEFAAEIAALFGLAMLVIVVILAFVFWTKPRGGLRWWQALRRTAADTALTLAAIVAAIVWMQGIGALLGPGYLGWIGGLTEVTQIIPVLLVGLGVDYAIHLTSRYRQEVGSGAAVAAAADRAARTVGVALVLATLTTVVGFLTNLVNPVPALTDFGVLAAIGIASAFVIMLTLVPAVRLLLDRRAEARERLPRESLVATGDRLLPNLAARAAVAAERVPVATLIVTVLIGGVLGAWGASNLETRFSFTDFVPEDEPLLATLDTLEADFGGGFGETTDVLLEGDVATVEAHNTLVEVQRDLAAVDGVVLFGDRAAATSPVSLLAALVTPGAEGQPPAPEVAQAAAREGLQPDLTFAEGADVAAVYQAMLEAAPPQAAQVLAADGGEIGLARVDIRTTAGEDGAAELGQALEETFAPLADAGVEATATSQNIITSVVVSALQDSQVQSLVITIAAAMLLLVVTFGIRNRRPLLGVITIAPIALVLLWTFAAMAATDIPFGPVTATISALAIGIGVPYTIHVTRQFLEDAEGADDPADAVRKTVRHTGGALAGSAFTTAAGFGVLVTSSLAPFQQFGLVTAYAIFFALFASILVLPSMLVLYVRWRGNGRKATPPPTQEAPKEPVKTP